MPLIFFDANVYLDAYRHEHQEYLKLLPYVATLRPHMLVTEILVREVNRNKLRVYLEYRKTFMTPKSQFPSIFPYHTKNDQDKSAFNRECKNLKRKYDSLMNDISDFIDDTHAENVRAISNGIDYISLSLRNLLNNPISATDAQMKRARLRKELGDPPGKSKNPLGDQITWEQLLDSAKERGVVWIVTADRDYHYTHSGNAFLNPTLYAELKAVQGVTSIHCFSRLGDFFENLRETDILKPNDQPSPDLTKAANTEVNAMESPRRSFVDLGKYPDHMIVRGYQKPCPKTESGAHVVGGAALFPSPLGGLTFQGPCILCGQWTDTQELPD